MHYPTNPSWKDIDLGVTAFRRREGRDSMYRVALHLLNEDQWWGNHDKMVDALKVLLLTWNNAFYRYGPFSEDELEASLRRNWVALGSFRKRTILSYSSQDDAAISVLFQDFCRALAIARGKKDGQRSPVGVAKALHMLAPRYFPLWDKKIASAYGCRYGGAFPEKAYIRFIQGVQPVIHRLQEERPMEEDSILKRLDEYNYSRFTKPWWNQEVLRVA